MIDSMIYKKYMEKEPRSENMYFQNHNSKCLIYISTLGKDMGKNENSTHEAIWKRKRPSEQGVRTRMRCVLFEQEKD
jgi:hypothetical protein